MSSEPRPLNPPVFVIGAGRSGTTMIREALSKHADIAAFEYEMNYLWRYGNSSLPHDMLSSAEHLTGKIAKHIRDAFAKESVAQGKPVILDKTVANVMRPKYIQSVFPGARFLHVIRDGRAVTASALKRWSAPQPATYFAAKLRTIPLLSLPLVIGRYARNKLVSRARKRNYRQSWGPRWPGIDEAVRDLPLYQVCAMQWRESVVAARSQSAELEAGTYLEVRYEDLVQAPAEHFEQIRRFFGLRSDDNFVNWIEAQIDAARRNKWQEELAEDQMDIINGEIAQLLGELGYQ